MTTTTTTPQRFTETTWADVFGPGLSRDTAMRKNYGWMALHDLAVELHERIDHMSFEHARELVSAAANGLPIRITWEVDKRDPYTDVAYTDRTTATVVIDQLMSADPNVYNLHYRAWGGGSCIPVAWVTDVEVPSAEYQFGIPRDAA